MLDQAWLNYYQDLLAKAKIDNDRRKIEYLRGKIQVLWNAIAGL